MALRRWNCFCGATGNAGQFCQWCGRRDPGVEPPPLPAAPSPDAPPAFDPMASFAPPGADAARPAPLDLPVSLRWGYDTARVPRVGITPVTRMLGVLLAVLLGTGVVTVDRRYEDRRLSVAGPDGRTLKTAIAEAKAFIEEFRGKPFLRDVEVELLDDEEFTEELLDGRGGDDSDEGEDYEETLKGLQLAGPNEDVAEAEEELLSVSVVGFYDDGRRRLVVRGRTFDRYAERTLVHELAHAWQDQHFDFDDMWDRVDSEDEELALRALIEGDANRTEAAWLDAQSEEFQEDVEERDDAETEAYTDDDDDDRSPATESLEALRSFPYYVGEEFVDALFESGGNDAIDDAFEDPPTASVQILEPDKYLEGDEPDDAVDPQPGGDVLDRGTLGAATLIVTVGFDSIDVLTEWDGDEYVTWESDDVTCTTVSLVLDSTAARDRLVALLRDGRVADSANIAPRNDGVVFTSCEDD